jgi:hypothetical protein
MRLFAKRCLSRVRGLQAILEDWQADRRLATLGVDLEQLVLECIDDVEVAKQAWMQLREMLLHDPNGNDVESTGQALIAATSRLISTSETLQLAACDAILGSQANGRLVESLVVLQTALSGIREVHSRLISAFPVFDTSSDEDDIAAFKRGEYITTEELFRELQGSGPAAD